MICTILLGGCGKQKTLGVEDYKAKIEEIKAGKTDYEVRLSGEYAGVKWQVTTDGILLLSGEDLTAEDSNFRGAPWQDEYVDAKAAYVNVKNMHSMSVLFRNNALLYVDLSDQDTSQVTDMSALFANCKSLEKIDFGDFDTSNVEDMSGMFAYCEKLENVDVSFFHTDKVTDMSAMFTGCYLLRAIDLSCFDTKNVVKMDRMFSQDIALEELDLTSFDFTSVENLDSMFFKCSAMKEIKVNKTWNEVKISDSTFEECKINQATIIE